MYSAQVPVHSSVIEKLPELNRTGSSSATPSAALNESVDGLSFQDKLNTLGTEQTYLVEDSDELLDSIDCSSAGSGNECLTSSCESASYSFVGQQGTGQVPTTPTGSTLHISVQSTTALGHIGPSAVVAAFLLEFERRRETGSNNQWRLEMLDGEKSTLMIDVEKQMDGCWSALIDPESSLANNEAWGYLQELEAQLKQAGIEVSQCTDVDRTL